MTDPTPSSGRPEPRSASVQLARILPALLLFAVASSQIYLAHFEGLTPSKGGGYGMFSTVDKFENRLLRIHGLEGELDRGPVDLPADLLARPRIVRAISRAGSLPRPTQMQRLANLIARRGGFERDFSAIRIEIWKLAFDRDTRITRRIRIAYATASTRRTP